MSNCVPKEVRFLDYEEYVIAKKRKEELLNLLMPWNDEDYHGWPARLRPEAPEGYDALLAELREVARNVRFTEMFS